MTGWPWPLDAVQYWFEDLWRWIGEAATSAVSAVSTWINDSMSWLYTQLSAGWDWIVSEISTVLNDAWTALQGGLSTLSAAVLAAISTVGSGIGEVGTWLYENLVGGIQAAVDTIGSLASTLGSSVSSAISVISSALQDIGSWITNTIWGWVDGALKWASDSFEWLRDQVNETGAFVVTQVHDVLAGAFTGLGEVVNSLFGPFIEPAATFMSTFTDLGAAIDPGQIMADVTGFIVDLSAMITAALTPKSPRTPAEALRIAWDTINETTTIYMSQASSLLIAEVASLGQVDITPNAYMHTPQLEAANNLVSELYSVMAESSLIIPLRQYYMRAFKPMIPPAPDLIRMVVREAFVEEMIIKAPSVFVDYMEFSGFSSEWSDRYWTAHFEPIALTQAYANLWRGYWDKDQFLYALHIADVHPMWREDIYNVAYRPLTRRELRYGWETGTIGPEKMVEAFMAMGLSPGDAEIATEAAIEYALHEERMGVLREWMSDFQDGLIDEDTLRANMTSIKIIGVRQDYYVERSTIRRERIQARALLSIYDEAYRDDLINDEELETRAREILVDEDAINLYVEKAFIRKYKKPKAA